MLVIILSLITALIALKIKTKIEEKNARIEFYKQLVNDLIYEKNEMINELKRYQKEEKIKTKSKIADDLLNDNFAEYREFR